jgi:protein-S-isoprenylcysteine O-methyltransferase Ste14
MGRFQQPTIGLDEFGRRRLVQVVSIILLMGALYFIAAGSLKATWGWVWLAVGLVSLVVGGLYVLRINPAVINERGRPAERQKSWDKALMLVYLPIYLGAYIVSGLDWRFSWSDMPLWLHLVGILGTLASGGLTYAAMAHNPFLAQVVQVAEERGHRVATSGPYRYVRHPMYASLLIGWLTMGWLFGSWWAFIPAGLAALILIIRTALEDRTLQTELPGYAEYAAKTRYRLLPGVW